MRTIDVLLILFAYLAGSLSSAILVCRGMGLPDPRTFGSGNPGATNVLRLGGKRAAALTLLGDGLKGTLSVLAGHAFGVSPTVLAGVGLAAFLGHLYPIFFGFRGGKGVATALGVQFGLYWPIGASVAALWLIIARVTRISSLSALVSMGLSPLVIGWWWPDPALMGMGVIVTVLLFWRHRSNILSLWRGTEDAIDSEDPPATQD
ncbi:MAG: glycerol-3-phosphate 1-O-acyltransferase PlsY [Pseudomonadota bacterium]